MHLYLYKMSSKKLQCCSTKLVMRVPNLGWPHKFSMQQKSQKVRTMIPATILSEKHALIALAITQQLKPTTWILNDIKEPTKIEHITHSIYQFPEELDVFWVCSIWKMDKTGWWLSPTPLKHMSSSMGRMTSQYEMENKSHHWNHQPGINNGIILAIMD